MVTVTGRGDNPRFIYWFISYPFSSHFPRWPCPNHILLTSGVSGAQSKLPAFLVVVLGSRVRRIYCPVQFVRGLAMSSDTEPSPVREFARGMLGVAEECLSSTSESETLGSNCLSIGPLCFIESPFKDLNQIPSIHITNYL